MTTTLNRPTLVLNKNWVPIKVESLKESIKKIFKGTARFMDDETFGIHTWESWVDNFSIDLDDDPIDFGYEFLRGSSLMVRIPDVIVLSQYDKIPRTKIRLSRKNLLIRDRFKCKYCGLKLTSKTVTTDHVFPKSRGGKTEWTNVVCSCLRCNTRKGSKTIKEANLKLLSKPKAPNWSPLFSYITDNIPKSWEKFINTSEWNEIGYWDVELVD